jgi:hypothetical protein
VLYGDRIDMVAAVLGGYGLLMALAQLRLLPAAAVPAQYLGVHLQLGRGRHHGHALAPRHPSRRGIIGEYLLLTAITALTGGIALRTVTAISRRRCCSGILRYPMRGLSLRSSVHRDSAHSAPAALLELIPHKQSV